MNLSFQVNGDEVARADLEDLKHLGLGCSGRGGVQGRDSGY